MPRRARNPETEPVIRERRSYQQDNKPGVNPSIEKVTSYQQKPALATLPHAPVADHETEKKYEKVNAMKYHGRSF
jgi:hypothetical protein